MAGGFAVILIGGVEGLIHIGILHPVITSRPQLKLRPRQQRIIRVRIHLGEGEGCHFQRIGNGEAPRIFAGVGIAQWEMDAFCRGNCGFIACQCTVKRLLYRIGVAGGQVLKHALPISLIGQG